MNDRRTLPRLLASLLLLVAASLLLASREQLLEQAGALHRATSEQTTRQQERERTHRAVFERQTSLLNAYRGSELFLHLAPAGAAQELLSARSDTADSLKGLSIAPIAATPGFFSPATVDRENRLKSSARWQTLRLELVPAPPAILATRLNTLLQGTAAQPERCRLAPPETGDGIVCDIAWPQWTAP